MSEVIGALLLIVGFFVGIPIGVSLEINGKISETEFWLKLSNVTTITVKTFESLLQSIIQNKIQ